MPLHSGPHCAGCSEYVPPSALRKTCSVVWPWDHNKLSPEQTLAHLLALGVDEVCIRAPVYFAPLQPKHLAPVAQAFHDALVALCMSADIDISLWPVISLYNPELQADRIAEYAEHYDPEGIFLDAERHWVLDYIANLPRFLDRLATHKAAGRIKCPVGLASYRRASGWPTMHWQVWLKHQLAGLYTIDFLAHQLYPIGWNLLDQYAYQTRLDVQSHEEEVRKSGRLPMDWFPFLPAFAESGWTAQGAGVQRQVEQLQAMVGERLRGANAWSLDQDMILKGPTVNPALQSVYTYLQGALYA